jgi:glycosyltransferase involved in cell wall biosynthesis
MPAVSVIMSVHNGSAFLAEAIESILNQDYKDFEFIIINDASTDASGEIIRSYNDSRIIAISNSTNLGLTKSLNLALKIAKGIYVARMDADDISKPDRFEKQVSFLNKHPDVGFCGTQVFYSNQSKTTGFYPMEYEEIKVAAMSMNPFAHPTVVFRRKLFADNNLFYDEEYKSGQDYELWSRALFVTKGVNLKERLLVYRVHNNQIGHLFIKQTSEYVKRIQLSFLTRLGIQATDAELNYHFAIFGNGLKELRTAEDLDNVELWLKKLLFHNSQYKLFDDQAIINYWATKIYGNGLYSYNREIYYWSRSSIARKATNIGWLNKLSFLIKSLIRKENPVAAFVTLV